MNPRIAKLVSGIVAYVLVFDASGQIHNSPSAFTTGSINTLIKAYSDEHPQLFKSACFVRTLRTTDRLITPSQIGFVHYLIARVNNNADEFMNLLMTGDGVGSSSPIFEVRRQLLSSKMGNHKLSTPVAIKRIIKAYNYWNAGKEGLNFKAAYALVDADTKIGVGQ